GRTRGALGADGRRHGALTSRTTLPSAARQTARDGKASSGPRGTVSETAFSCTATVCRCALP
ncbi:MAG TPA: hypothetical protein VN238_01265, partial [Solirubrobacteraceae bacterium]|nr:hypothetical protein [Solirubrobacteraceae bacterium]